MAEAEINEFPIPASAVNPAIQKLRQELRGVSFPYATYAQSIREVMVALVELGWTIKPPTQKRDF